MRTVIGIVEVLVLLAGIVFLGLAGLVLFMYWTGQGQGLQGVAYANEAQTYGTMAIACFLLTLAIDAQIDDN